MPRQVNMKTAEVVALGRPSISHVHKMYAVCRPTNAYSLVKILTVRGSAFKISRVGMRRTSINRKTLVSMLKFH